MTKKLLAALLAIAVMLTACVFVFAEDAGTPESDTDVTVTITFDGNGATAGAMDPITADSEGKATLPTNAYTKDHYNFDGWNTNDDGSGTDYEDGAEITVTESITLYAQWLHENVTDWVEYTVTYDANGGEGETVDEFSPYMQGTTPMAVYNNFTREGYTFKGWNTKADGTGTTYQPDETFDITADTVLYAIWESNNPVVPSEPTPSVPVVPSTPSTPSVDGSTVPEVESVVEEDTTVTDTDANPGTGDTVATTIALGAAVVALGAFVVLKKKD